MATKRHLSPEHKQKLSQAATKRHADLKKGISTAAFGAQSSEYEMSVSGFRSMNKSLTPDQAYQLSIDVRSAISAISNNIAKMKIKLYNARSGAEIVGGELFEFFKNPAPRYTQSRWLAELASYYSLVNEVGILRDPGPGTPRYLMPLNPGKLFIQEPTQVRDLSQIKTWLYLWEDGMSGQYSASQICFDKLFNPVSQVRGLSPILTGMNEISSSYQAARYNKTFFENGAVPSHILMLPEGTPRQTRLDIENRYLATFGIGDGNGHKVLVVSGGDAQIKELSNRPKDAEFVQLSNLNTQKVAQLFKVPAIEMGLYDKTRFETAAVEREMFYENTLMPLANRISDFLQDQIVDRWFSNTSQKTIDAQLSKSKKAELDKAIANSNSSVVVLIDTDSSPIAAKIMRDRVQATAELRRSAGLSFNEAASYLGLDLPEPKENPTNYRDMVFINSGEQRIDNLLKPVETTNVTETNTQIVPDETDDQYSDTEVIEVVDKDLVKSLQSFLRKYRKIAVIAADNQKMFTLRSVDNIVKEVFTDKITQELIKHVVRLDYKDLDVLVSAGDFVGVKDVFNDKDRKWVKAIAKEIQKVTRINK